MVDYALCEWKAPWVVRLSEICHFTNSLYGLMSLQAQVWSVVEEEVQPYSEVDSLPHHRYSKAIYSDYWVALKSLGLLDRIYHESGLVRSQSVY